MEKILLIKKKTETNIDYLEVLKHEKDLACVFDQTNSFVMI